MTGTWLPAADAEESVARFLSGTSAVSIGMDAIREMHARWAVGDLGEDDQWGDMTAEPRGLDYAEVSADGVPAMWLVPHGADPDRAIVALHGGGFVGRGDSERLARLTGARLDVFDGQLHTFQMAAGRAPVADEAIGTLATPS